ncbi:MAG: ATP-binding protein [Helicobacter sp.]|nr:ATP-binding protein [Helicobacter sp.]
MENKQQSKKEISMKSVNGSRGILIHNFRNIGVYKESSTENGAFLRLSSLKSLGGLVCILGENNTGKSNLLAALVKLGKISEIPALNEDKPDFFGYETCLPKIALSYRVPKQLNETHGSEKDKLSGKTYSIVYSFEDWKRAKEYEMQHLRKEQWQEQLYKVQKFEQDDFDLYINELQDTLNNLKVSCYYNTNKEHVYLTLRDKRRIVECELRGEYLKCIKDYSVDNLRDNLSVPIACQFVINGIQKVDNAMDIMELFIPNKKQSVRDGYEEVRVIMYLDEDGQTQNAYFPDIKTEQFNIATAQELILSKYKEVCSYCKVEEDEEWFDRFNANKDNPEFLNIIYEELKEKYQKYEENDFFRKSIKSHQKLLGVDLQFIPMIDFPKLRMPKIQSPQFPNINLGIPLIPTIILYVETNLSHKDLMVAPDKIHDSPFFKSLFTIIEEDMDIVRKVYEKSQETQNPGYRSRAEKNVNEKLKCVNQRFNDLYNKDDEVYRFQIRLEDSKISLEFYKNGETLTLDKQSVGFRKFFNFFFNFLYAGTIGKGDIVLIDEAETHLASNAQGEFRKFLKEFGQEHGILFVITTHSPFMLDMNHLDEIRILKTKEDGLGVEIINEFSKVTDSDVDILKKIIEALGAKVYHLINPKTKPIFVEGVTDYHYLVALAVCYNKEHDKPINLAFLPIGGLGEEEQQQIEKMKSLISFGKDLRISQPILLVDHDGAGRAIKKLEGEKEYKDSLQVIPLNECETLKSKFPQNVEIEDLFSKKDREKFGISKEEKNSQTAADFKNTKDLEKQLDEETKGNFYALLDYLDSL